ncbi:hypothetical protein NQ317_006424 [Molorchus minor]|uniref:THAP-type domain-containing protein n=1 Tax=Molorchus minor TaxID=1323400 RepID=A0ABQ9J2N4_9CUCU|nr:hypothetical protein NQ317_006424 [Molorchus minor]
MNSSYYKYCIVRQCKSTIKTLNKFFIYVPNNEQIRKKWLKLARRDDVHSLSTNSRMYFCADYFDWTKAYSTYFDPESITRHILTLSSADCQPQINLAAIG